MIKKLLIICCSTSFAPPTCRFLRECLTFLSCRIEDVDLHLLVVQHHLLSVRVCLRWLVVFHELIDGKIELVMRETECHSISAGKNGAIVIEIVRQSRF